MHNKLSLVSITLVCVCMFAVAGCRKKTPGQQAENPQPCIETKQAADAAAHNAPCIIDKKDDKPSDSAAGEDEISQFGLNSPFDDNSDDTAPEPAKGKQLWARSCLYQPILRLLLRQPVFSLRKQDIHPLDLPRSLI